VSGQLPVALTIIPRRLRNSGRHAEEENSAAGQVFSTVAVAEEAIITNALKAIRQNMPYAVKPAPTGIPCLA